MFLSLTTVKCGFLLVSSLWSFVEESEMIQSLSLIVKGDSFTCVWVFSYGVNWDSFTFAWLPSSYGVSQDSVTNAKQPPYRVNTDSFMACGHSLPESFRIHSD